MNLTTVGKTKYLFQKQIESGVFDIFNSNLTSKEIFLLHLENNELNIHKQHDHYTTFRAFLIYLNSTFDSKTPQNSIKEWENIKALGLDLSLIIDDNFVQYSYFQHLNEQTMKSIHVPLSNFNTLLNFGFSKKSIFIENHIVKEAIDNVDLSKTPPLYAINYMLKNNETLNYYLNTLCKKYPDIDLGFGIHLLDFKNINDKNVLKHFIKNNLKENNDFTSKLISQIYINFDKKEINDLLKDVDIDFKNISKNVIEDILNEPFEHLEEKSIFKRQQCIELFLENLESKKINLEHLKLSDFKNYLLENNKIILKLLDHKLNYKDDLQEYIYELSGKNKSQKVDFIVFMKKNNLLDINEKNNNNISFVDYYNNLFNNIENKREKLDLTYNLRFSLGYLKPSINKLCFPENLNQKFFFLFISEIIKYDFMEKTALDNYFKTNNFLIPFLSESKEKILIYHLEHINSKYLLNNEEDYKYFLEYLSNDNIKKTYDEITKQVLCANLLIGNQKQNFILKNLNNHTLFFLNITLNYLEDTGTIDPFLFNTTINLVYKINRNTLFENTEINEKYKKIINGEHFIKKQLLHFTQIKEYDDFFQQAKQNYSYKYISYEKKSISQTIIYNENKKINNKRL